MTVFAALRMTVFAALRMTVFAALRMTVFAALRMTVFAALRMTVFAALRMTVFASPLAGIFFVLTFAVPHVAAAPPEFQPPRILGVHVGLADRYKAGLWTPVEIALRGGSEAVDGELSVLAPDSDGVPGSASRPCRLRPGQETSVSLVTRPGRVHGELTVELKADGRLLARRVFTTADRADADHFLPALEAEDVIVTVGGSALGVEALARLAGDPESAPVAAALNDPRKLPADPSAYEGAKAVLLATDHWDVYRGLAPTTRTSPRSTSGCRWADDWSFRSVHGRRKRWPSDHRCGGLRRAGFGKRSRCTRSAH